MSGTFLKIVAVVGESQVGKSSLVNAILGVNLLPTSGEGRPRSQTPCEFRVAALPEAAHESWRVEVDWLPVGEQREVLWPPEGPRLAPRAALFREGAKEAIPAEEAMLHSVALGRDVQWVNLGRPCTSPQARRHLDLLTGGWAAALTTSVRVYGIGPHRLSLVDLPGVGTFEDAGAQATSRWLGAWASSVAAIVCVIGQRGLGQALALLLETHWSPGALRERLHVVTTFADRQVEDPSSSEERAQVARDRQRRAGEQFTPLFGSSPPRDLPRRTYCVDPRLGRVRGAVEFEGELERLRGDVERPCAAAAASAAGTGAR